MSNDAVIELKSMRLLTEHFGYPPIEVIDDIINAINDIMYRCTEQLEQILLTQKEQLDEEKRVRTREIRKKREEEDIIIDEGRLDDGSATEAFTIKDIQMGTATLESYFEHHINRNFDKFELYAFRNVFNLPYDLVKGGYIRMKHHESIKLDDVEDINETDNQLTQEIFEKIQDIRFEMKLNKVLNESLEKCTKLSKVAKVIKLKLEPFLSERNKQVMAKLSPLNDTLLYLIKQARTVMAKIDEIKDSITDERIMCKLREKSEEDEQLSHRIDMMIDNMNRYSRTVDSKAQHSTGKVEQQLANFFT